MWDPLCIDEHAGGVSDAGDVDHFRSIAIFATPQDFRTAAGCVGVVGGGGGGWSCSSSRRGCSAPVAKTRRCTQPAARHVVFPRRRCDRTTRAGSVNARSLDRAVYSSPGSSGMTTRPRNRITPDSSSRMRNRNGRSARKLTTRSSGLTPPPPPKPPPVVTAAASVPISLTSMNVFWRTLLIAS